MKNNLIICPVPERSHWEYYFKNLKELFRHIASFNNGLRKDYAHHGDIKPWLIRNVYAVTSTERTPWQQFKNWFATRIQKKTVPEEPSLLFNLTSFGHQIAMLIQDNDGDRKLYELLYGEEGPSNISFETHGFTERLIYLLIEEAKPIMHYYDAVQSLVLGAGETTPLDLFLPVPDEYAQGLPIHPDALIKRFPRDADWREIKLSQLPSPRKRAMKNPNPKTIEDMELEELLAEAI